MKIKAGGNPVRIALAGNPNAGKTTLFNALTGARHKVGNYPGVTVEKREGSRRRGSHEYIIIDLPGIYSLSAYSLDEAVTRDFLLDEQPEVIIDVIDSTNLERSLYLCLQFQELGIPVVGALNMSDEASATGIRIDGANLSAVLGIPMVKTVGITGSGIDELLDAVDRILAKQETGMWGEEPRSIQYDRKLEGCLSSIQAMIASDPAFASRHKPRWLAVKLLENDTNARERLMSHAHPQPILTMAHEKIAWIAKHFGKEAQIITSEQRYGYIHGAVQESLLRGRKPDCSFTETLDKMIMNRFLALPIFVAVLWSVFQLTFTLGKYPMDWLEYFFAFLSRLVSNSLPEGILGSLLVDGIIGGVGSVFSFVPLIVILFMLLSILEDSGYMSRAAFATDRLLHAFGLHGQSVFPMMLGFGCSVPAIMAARTLKSPRDRIVTVLAIPFMSCSAKLPVHILLAGAFFPENPAAIVMLIYAIGILLSLLSAFVLKRTILKGVATPFVMELPPYRSPTLSGVISHAREKTGQYIKKAGGVILFASILIWATTGFPRYETSQTHNKALNPVNEKTALERSFAGMIGKAIEPVFRPLGFDWKIAVATITGFAAKEMVVSTLGILYRESDGQNLGARLAADPGFSPLVAFALMLFTLAIPPCFAALAVIKSELGWRWLIFAFAFMLMVGWTLSFAVFQIGSLIGMALPVSRMH